MSNFELNFGIHSVMTLLDEKPEKIHELWVSDERNDQRLQQLIAKAQQLNITVKLTSRQKLDAMVEASARHQGVVAMCVPMQNYVEADLPMLLEKIKGAPFVLILDGVQDPHNLGACLRSADAAGVHVVIAPRDRSVGITPVVRKVASGAAETVPFIQVTNLARTLKTLQEEHQIWLYGAAGDAPKTVYEVDLTGGVGLVLGAEGKGLRQLTREICDYLISIPMKGKVESLNVSVATGICAFEVVRQRCYSDRPS